MEEIRTMSQKSRRSFPIMIDNNSIFQLVSSTSTEEEEEFTKVRAELTEILFEKIQLLPNRIDLYQPEDMRQFVP